jgi:hypothetical protein
MVPQTPRHDFLHELHKLLRPKTYLEIGVQSGRGLAQALPDTRCVGVDPAPQIRVPIAARYRVAPMTSDEFFELSGAPGERFSPIDLAFIDGMHLVEYALRDFIGVEKHARRDHRSVAVFDDVLPYSADIAGREPLPGDWTGDVWKIDTILHVRRPDLTKILVNVDPTGVLVVLGLDPASTALPQHYDEIADVYTNNFTPPDRYINRSTAVTPAVALEIVRDHIHHHLGG